MQLFRRAGSGWLGHRTVLAAACLLAASCSPIVREPPFGGARDQVADASLLGPFNGQIVDETTKAPIGDATVVGVWSYERGDGLAAPAGSETMVVKTDRAGRYRIAQAPAQIRGATVRLVAFTLFVYKRGYLAWRSDVPYDEGARLEFVARHNRVALRKWAGTDDHAEHLVMLAPPPEIERLTDWERQGANTALARADSEQPVEPTGPAIELLDATALLPPEEVRRRTLYTDPFQVGELTDLARTHFYHGLHLRAVDREEVWDVGLRVWKDPPGGLDPVRQTIEVTLPGVQPGPEVTAETWVLDSEAVRAVAFLDRERSIAVLLTCGGMQCADIETALVLAHYVFDNLDKLRTVAADAIAPAQTQEATPP
ncbi:MAG: hypothetical protein K1X88_23390 [Nannocystaceae bacterium]|nr:hypothetical protein [Nannocystaceae bacterium]